MPNLKAQSKLRLLVVSLILLAGVAGLAHAQHQNHGAGHAAPAAPATDTPAIAAFKAANASMHRAMAIDFSGNPDVDFVRGMIPHHEGAIAMAKILLQFGRDEQTRRWAADIIREQEREIGEMRSWLRRNGG